MMCNKTAFRFLTLLLAGMLITVSCGVTSLDTGGSSGTEVSCVSGTVIDQNGNPVADALVRLRPALFLAESADDSTYRSTHSIIDTLTATDGTFALSAVEADSYVVEISFTDTLGSATIASIDSSHSQVVLPPLLLTPLARLFGNINFGYETGAIASVQVYGLDRSVTCDSNGNFSLLVPPGKHRIHLGAKLDSATATKEFDSLNLSFEFAPGDQRDAGSFRLRWPPSPPCTDGSCDTAVVRMILQATGNDTGSLDSVVVTKNGRIIVLNLRSFDLSAGIPFDVNRLTALRVLDLSNTGLPSMFPDIGRMEQLEIVKLGGNALEDFSSTVGFCKFLRELDLHGNRLTSLNVSLLNCEQLVYLDVSYNRLCAVEAPVAAWLDKTDPDWKVAQKCN